MSKGGKHGIRLHGGTCHRSPQFLGFTQRGQAIVEFTLIFVLLLIVAWIPADFGLAFYTGQLTLNASRDGARIAAADPTLTSGTVSCTMPACSGNILGETAARLSSALLPGATITVTYPVGGGGGGGGCNNQVRVRITGTYNFFFYHLLNWFGFSIDPTANIDYFTDMRWEHQC